MDVGPAELIIVLVIVLLLFGPGRVANLGGELGKAIHEFRKGVNDGADKPAEPTAPASDTPPGDTKAADTVL